MCCFHLTDVLPNLLQIQLSASSQIEYQQMMLKLWPGKKLKKRFYGNRNWNTTLICPLKLKKEERKNI